MNNTASNVTPIADKQPQPQAKFTITCTLDGFPVEISGEGRAGDLRIIIDRMKAIGAEPPQANTSRQNDGKSAPTCPVHNSPMKPSRKPGAFFCPRRTDDGDYCPHKA